MTTATTRWDGFTADALRDPYGRSLLGLAEEGAAGGRAGDYLVLVLAGRPDGRYESSGAQLEWRDPAPDATVRVDVAVADAADGRFVPGLTVYVSAERDGRTHAAQQCTFRWHPALHRYTTDLRVRPGRYDLTVRIGAPVFARDDRAAGHRYADPAVLRLSGVVLTGER